ncbi:N-formyl peptide receptor 3-like [Leptodactylus fuscus]|uniref:N-formyl peptide receptor 3-like n=1 Tax=Leptodactylus fuscus TaxID=238119 RepID=UPI003F4EE648
MTKDICGIPFTVAGLWTRHPAGSFYPEYELNDTTYDSYYVSNLEKISFSLNIITFVLGIIGNGLVIWIAGFRMKKTISAVWFLHLAIADFLCCAGILLLIALYLHIVPYIPNVDLVCLLIIILFVINMSASVLLLTAMSIDRCVSVMWPFWAKVHRTRRLVRITAGGIWVFSVFLAGLNWLSNGWCIYHMSYNEYMYNHKIRILVGLVTIFVIPFLIIVTSYVIIFIKIRKSKRPQRSQRPYRIITAVILCFFICWSPYFTWPLILNDYLSPIQGYTIFVVATHLAFLNSCLNPIIYVFMGQNIKPYFFRSIPARIERALSDYPEEPNREPEDLELQ